MIIGILFVNINGLVRGLATWLTVRQHSVTLEILASNSLLKTI